MAKHSKTEMKEKTSTKDKQKKSDIGSSLDAMFKSKASKAIKKKEKKVAEPVKKETKPQMPPKEEKSKPRKYVDGLAVFTEAELNIGQGGNTEDCPFDCNCCF